MVCFKEFSGEMIQFDYIIFLVEKLGNDSLGFVFWLGW